MLKNRTWLPENTEILTPNGWMPIKNLAKIHKLMTDIEIDLKEFNVREFDGKIPKRKKDFYFQGIVYLKDGCVEVGFNCKEVTPIWKRPYKGKLYNIVTSTNEFYARTIFKDKSNNQFLCLSVK